MADTYDHLFKLLLVREKHSNRHRGIEGELERTEEKRRRFASRVQATPGVHAADLSATTRRAMRCDRMSGGDANSARASGNAA